LKTKQELKELLENKYALTLVKQRALNYVTRDLPSKFDTHDTHLAKCWVLAIIDTLPKDEE
jgi:hypothetical protein